MLPLDLAALPVRIKVRPDSLAQVLDREGVVALTVKCRYERSFDSTETPDHKRYHTEQVFRMQTLKDVATLLGGARLWRTVRRQFSDRRASSPIEPAQSGEAPNLLRFCHIAPQMHIQGERRMDSHETNRHSALATGRRVKCMASECMAETTK